MKSKPVIEGFIRLATHEIWIPVIAISLAQIFLLLFFPLLRSPSNVYLLLYGPYIYLALAASILLSPILGLIGFAYDIPDYRPWQFSEIAFVIFVSVFLISCGAVILFRLYTRNRYPRRKAIAISMIWSLILVHLLGDLLLLFVASVVSSIGPY